MKHIYNMTIFRYNFWKEILENKEQVNIDDEKTINLEYFKDSIVDSFVVEYNSLFLNAKYIATFNLVVDKELKSFVTCNIEMVDLRSGYHQIYNEKVKVKNFSLDKTFNVGFSRFKIRKVSVEDFEFSPALHIMNLVSEHYKSKIHIPLYAKTGYKNIRRWKLENDIYNLTYKPSLIKSILLSLLW